MTWLQHVGGRALWLVGGAVLVFSWLHRSDASAALDSVLAAGHQEAQTAGKFHQQLADSSQKVVAALHAKARLEQDTTELRVQRDQALTRLTAVIQSVDSLHRAPLTPAVRRYAEACGEQIQNCEQRVGNAMLALQTEHGLRVAATARAAHADSLIATGVKVAQCRWLWWRCPDRDLVAALGFIAGVLTAASVVHH